MVAKVEWGKKGMVLSRQAFATSTVTTSGQGRSLRWSNGQALRLTCP